MEINVFQVDAFSKEPFGGNPAGVVTNSKGITEEYMQRIANEMNLPETAFIRQMDDCLFKVRYFTPICEVDLCGHATIASVYLLAKNRYIRPIEKGYKPVKIETNIGPLKIEIEFEKHEPINIVMELGKPSTISEVKEIEELLACFNLSKEDVGIENRYMAPEIISTGLPDIILPIKNKDLLFKTEVDFCRLRDLSNELGVTAVHAFYLENDGSRAFARNFAPAVGIEEEAATGTSNGAMTYYLKKKGILEKNSLVVHQGDTMNRPSIINCYIQGENGDYLIKVSGSATVVMEGIIKY